MSLRTLLRKFDRFRRNKTKGLTKWLMHKLGNSRHLVPERLGPDQVRRILIVRNNKRIGNMYFMLPFVRQTLASYPNAKIDLMIISPSQAKVFANLGLHEVLISNFAFATAWSFLKTMLKARKTVYDLLIMPHSSSSDTLICAFIHARNKVAFWGEETSGIFRHAIRQEPDSPHAALSALTLLKGPGLPEVKPDPTLELSEYEIRQGDQIAQQLRGDARYCFAYFRGARGAKVIDDQTWRNIRAEFDRAAGPGVRWVEILSPDVTQALEPDTQTYQTSDLRLLGSVLRAMDLFICADTGPLHLADASGARCIGLYNATNPLHYGCLNDQSINLTEIDRIDAKSILQKILRSP